VSLVLAAVLAAGIVTAAPRVARAASSIIKQNETHKYWDLGALFHFMWLGGIGTGVRLGIPVGPRGFVPTLNDQVKLELGISFRYWWPRWYYCDPHERWCDEYRRHGFGGLSIPLLLRWDFFLLEKLTIYLTFGLEANIIFENWWMHDYRYRSFLWYPVIPSFSFGVLFNFHERISLRAEFAITGFNIGIEFRL
jgi:hypothetical protein